MGDLSEGQSSASTLAVCYRAGGLASPRLWLLYEIARGVQLMGDIIMVIVSE
jgi:hypothetical protein